MDTLIDSSPTTLEWLESIKSKIEEKLPSIEYSASKHWASFKSPEANRNFVYLHPQKRNIRLFTRLDTSIDNSLRSTPSSKAWAERYPSIFVITSKDSIDKAVELIISSYRIDLRK